MEFFKSTSVYLFLKYLSVTEERGEKYIFLNLLNSLEEHVNKNDGAWIMGLEEAVAGGDSGGWGED